MSSKVAIVITFLEDELDSQGLVGTLASLDWITCRH